VTAAGASVWSRALARWTSWVAQHWLVVLAVLALGTAVAGTYVVERLGINTDTAGMLSDELEFRRNYETYKDMFPQYVDTLLLVVEAEAPELADAAVDRLAARLRSDETRFERIYRPGGGDFVHRHGLLYMELPALRELADRLVRMQPFMGTLTHDPSLRGLLTLLRRALDEAGRQPIPLEGFLRRVEATVASTLAGRPAVLSWRDLLSGDASGSGTVHRALLVAQPHMDWDSLLPGAAAIEAVHRQARAAGIGPDTSLRLRVTGDVALAHEELLSLKRSAGRVALLALSMVLAVLFLGLRSPRLVLATLVTLLSGIVWTAAFAALAVGRLNLISVAFALLYVGLGVDFAIHLALAQQQGQQEPGQRRQALRDAGRRIGPALALCAVTTAVGFYAFLPTAYAGVAELGLIAGTGMFISLLVSLVLLPALAMALRVPGRWQPGGGLTAGAGRLALRRPWAVLAVAGVLAATAGLLAPQARFDHNPLNLRDPQSESVVTFRELLAADEGRGWNAVVLAEGPEAAARSAAALAGQSTVEGVTWLESFVPGAQPDKLAVIDDMAFLLGELTVAEPAKTKPPALADGAAAAATALRGIPGERPWGGEAAALADALDAAAQALRDPGHGQAVAGRLHQALTGTLPFTLRRLAAALEAGPVAVDDLPDTLIERWRSPGGLHRVEAAPAVDLEDRQALGRFVAEARAVAPAVTGSPVVMLEASDAVLEAFRQAFLGALALIAVLLLVVLRSLRLTLLVLVPLLLGGLLTVAGTVLLGLSFNFANVIALPLLLGAGVDYGVHTVGRFRAEGGHSERLASSSTARAVLYSALSTIVGFGNLALSSHPGLASMGVVLTLGILVTLAATLLVLPALLSRYGPSCPAAGG